MAWLPRRSGMDGTGDVDVSSLAISLTMLACGLWHGAAWHFVLWGALHGAFLVVERLTGTGVDLDVRTKVARDGGWTPIPDLLEEVARGVLLESRSDEVAVPREKR